jgi:hypothetical protein
MSHQIDTAWREAPAELLQGHRGGAPIVIYFIDGEKVGKGRFEKLKKRLVIEERFIEGILEPAAPRGTPNRGGGFIQIHKAVDKKTKQAYEYSFKNDGIEIEYSIKVVGKARRKC